jgi:hypothetical protein
LTAGKVCAGIGIDGWGSPPGVEVMTPPGMGSGADTTGALGAGPPSALTAGTIASRTTVPSTSAATTANQRTTRTFPVPLILFA